MTQTSPVYRCVVSSRSYHLLSIHSLKFLIIHFMYRIPRVHHVIRSIILPSSDKRSKCYLHESSLILFNHSTFQRRVTSIPFFLKPCLDLTSVHSFENLPAHEEVNGIQTTPVPRLPMTCNIHPFLPRTVSQDLTHLPPRRIQKTPFQGFWRSEIHVLRLRIRLFRQDLACVYGDGFGSCFLIWVCFFNDYRWSTIHICRLFLFGCNKIISLSTENLSFSNLVSIFRCSSSPSNPVYVRHVESSPSGFSLSSHRHSYIGFVSSSHFIE
jgi:hypothetical protein